ncbi:hypothetical protein F511_36300 [Dorcoceras hygrometricum]|uniref:Uncharacterized protein n=1 Tax=Dorcoceras hygrometricum TaxID=472368 RepID=A0A2Z7CPT7_9LAMI|nr:hypothetical protein F511_36300 [Dorcoceras hygrometricum]
MRPSWPPLGVYDMKIKASTLKKSDIPLIKDRGMSDSFEVIIPEAEDRAHCPPNDFHTFFINQLDMGLSFLLTLGIPLSFFEIPLSTYTLMQLLQVERLEPGKFNISHKTELGFIGGNPSSHKGWMSRPETETHDIGNIKQL